MTLLPRCGDKTGDIAMGKIVVEHDLVATRLPIRVAQFLINRINRSGVEINQFPHGGFQTLQFCCSPCQAKPSTIAGFFFEDAAEITDLE